MFDSQHRLRRLRRTPALRALIRETELTVSDFVLPLFIKHGKGRKDPIPSMPGHFQFSPDNLAQEIADIRALGIPAVLLFGIPEHKDSDAKSATSPHGVIPQAIQAIKELAPEICVMTDVCCCEYTDHGHCGWIEPNAAAREVHNDKTLSILAEEALCHAQAGADLVAPSAMMDGQVAAIRQKLDTHGFSDLPILSYSAKYCSQFYNPFRQAAEGTPQFGDRKTYQMDMANGKEALREAALDINEGADMIMVKPAHTYLDVIFRLKQNFPQIPLAAYHVSGEFALIKAAAEKGWVDEHLAALEVLTSIKRAGADFIIHYFAKSLAPHLS